MIVKITHGSRFSGLMAYLAGPGREDEHTEARVLAGDPALVAWHGGETLDHRAALALAKDLDRARIDTGVEVLSRRRRWDAEARDYVDGVAGQAHVWQCSLSLHPDEPALSDEQWAAIAHDFMDRMGFDTADDPREPARWVAVHHGASLGGNDHIHIVANVVRQDGTKVAGYRDYKLASRAVHELERKYGLRIVEGRGFPSTQRPYSQSEDMQQRAERRAQGMTGKQVRDPDALVRHQVHGRVRAAAAVARDEAEFVRRLRQSGLQVRPRFAEGTQDVVVGYAVRVPGDSTAAASRWFAGGKLAKDLGLRALREGQGWSATPEAAMEAAGEWRRAGRGARPAVPGRETRPPQERDWRAWYARTDDVLQQLAARQDDPRLWARAAQDASGALAAWSTRARGPEAASLGRAARELSRSAWLAANPSHRSKSGPAAAEALGDVAVLIAAAPGKRGRALDAALLAQIMRLSQAVHKAHLSAGRVDEASRIERAVRQDLGAVRTVLPAVRSLADLDAQDARRAGTPAPDAGAPRKGGYHPAPAVKPDPERVVRPAPLARETKHENQQQHRRGRAR